MSVSDKSTSDCEVMVSSRNGFMLESSLGKVSICSLNDFGGSDAAFFVSSG